MEVSEYILRVLLNSPCEVMSWGFHAPEKIECGLAFSVNGFLHKGRVEVRYDEVLDLFDVSTLSEGGEVLQRQVRVYVDSLVETIDLMVELCEDYRERVCREYDIR